MSIRRGAEEEHCNRQRERGDNGGIDWRTHDQYLADGRRRRRSATHKTSLCNAQSSRHTSGAQNVLFSPRKYVQSTSANKIGVFECLWMSLKNFPFTLLALWGNKNWPPSMKVKKLENVQNKSSLKGCKWSSLNVPGTKPPLSHPILKLDESPFFHY